MLKAPDLRSLRSSIEKLASGTIILRGIDREVKGLLRQEFATGQGPYGVWQATKRGKQALQSKKLPQAFKSEIGPNGLRYIGKSKRDMLEAHQEGHEFKARSVGANKQFLTFKNGKLIRNSRALNKKGETKRGVSQTFARAHTVGARVLPQRQIVPNAGDIPPSWEQAMERGATNAVNGWYDKVQK